MIQVKGVTDPPFSTHHVSSSILTSFPVPCLHPCLRMFSLTPCLPLHHPPIIHSSPTQCGCGLVLCLCGSFVLTSCLCRSAVAVHRGRVPVHPAPGHRGHPHVFRSLSHRQRHRRPEAQRLRCHLHRALR